MSTALTASPPQHEDSTRLSPAGGVVLAGLDLARPLSIAEKQRIDIAFLTHHIVVFRNQLLSREEQFRFARQFGEVEAHGGHRGGTKRYDVAHVLSNLDANGKPSVRLSQAANYHWHTDKPYHAAPPMMTMLHAVQLPPGGSATEFANMRLAYDALSAADKDRVDSLLVGFGPAFDPARGTTAEHSLVRRDPATGAKSLYLGNHATRIAGLSGTESAALLEALLAHSTQPQFIYRHRWSVGDLVMWDNRCLLHRLVLEDGLQHYPRILYRSVVKGSVPR